MRDRLALALALVLPVGLIALLGTSISLTVTDIPIVIQDLDQTPLSRQYADAFRNSLTFRVVDAAAGDVARADAGPAAGRGRPSSSRRTSGARSAEGARAETQVLVDATDSNTARLIRGNASQITRAFAQQVGAAAARRR